MKLFLSYIFVIGIITATIQLAKHDVSTHMDCSLHCKTCRIKERCKFAFRWQNPREDMK